MLLYCVYMNHTFYYSKYNTILLCVLIIITSACLYLIAQGRYIDFSRNDIVESVQTSPSAKPVITEIDISMPSTSAISGTGVSDLIEFSIAPGQTVSDRVAITGKISGAYFFEGSMPFDILDASGQKTTVGPGYATATTEWMTAGAVSFSATVDFTNATPGLAYIRIAQDDPSGGESGREPRFVLIPIVVQ